MTRARRAAERLKEGDMRRWRNFLQQMTMELILLAYLIAWVAVLLVTNLLTK
jgi:hypothetical protein